jgi:hypothetical protein
MTDDNFKFATIPAPSSPDERRFVELVRMVIREENSKRDEAMITAVTNAVLSYSSALSRTTRSPA